MSQLLNTAREVTGLVSEEIDQMFDYQQWDTAMLAKGIAVRVALKSAVIAIVNNVPPSPDRSCAIRKICEAKMDCNSAITHAGKY